MGQGPLSGVRVLELGTLIAARSRRASWPTSAPRSSRSSRRARAIPCAPGQDARAALALVVAVQARNKRSVTLDLRKRRGAGGRPPPGAGSADIVVENFRPGRLEKLGPRLRACCAAENPRLVMVRISGFGQTGPYRDRPGFGDIAESDGRPALHHRLPRPAAAARRHLASATTIAALLRRDRRADGAAGTPSHAGAGPGRRRRADRVDLQLHGGLLPEYGATGLVRERSGNDLHSAAPSKRLP